MPSPVDVGDLTRIRLRVRVAWFLLYVVARPAWSDVRWVTLSSLCNNVPVTRQHVAGLVRPQLQRAKWEKMVFNRDVRTVENPNLYRLICTLPPPSNQPPKVSDRLLIPFWTLQIHSILQHEVEGNDGETLHCGRRINDALHIKLNKSHEP